MNFITLTSLRIYLALLAATACLTASPIQWPIALGGNDHFYELTPTEMNWDSAEAFAVSQGGHLVSINSTDEQAFLISAFFSGGNDHFIGWLGLSDASSEGTFVWTSGEAVTFTNWNVSEPNDFGGEDYVAMNWYLGNNFNWPIGTWNDVHIDGTITPQNPGQVIPYRGIYEVVPEPSLVTLLLVGALSFLRRRS